ncbi:phenylacetic acid degradation protein [Gemmatimonadetes bacterium T265]|nr:phenylacetic acid degradation protein [Gemmatimonadetes bacterium T265]
MSDGTATARPAVESLLRLGDDRLVLGHRLSEWCGHAPILEEDIALGNIALDLLGQAQGLLKLAGALEGHGRDEDALAYFRDAGEFRNVQLVELPRGDFAHTMIRQFLFDAYDVLLTDRLAGSPHADVAGIMAKAHKEARYHVRHSGDWVVRLGDGTDESHVRAQRALDALWPYTGELFAADAVDVAAAGVGLGVDARTLRDEWQAMVTAVVAESALRMPSSLTVAEVPAGGREGRHTEHLVQMLAEMQVVARAHPGASW